MIELTVITHYDQEDVDCSEDYYDIEIIETKTGDPMATFGDAYHDKGSAKTEGFIWGLEVGSEQEVKVTYKEVADRS